MTEEEKKKWEDFIFKNLDIKKSFGRYIHGIGQEYKYGLHDWPKITIQDEEAIEIFEKYNPKIMVKINEVEIEVKGNE